VPLLDVVATLNASIPSESASLRDVKPGPLASVATAEGRDAAVGSEHSHHPRCKRYTSGHVYRPKMFSFAFTNLNKHTAPIGVKRRPLVGR
jgi:hypothetical protein